MLQTIPAPGSPAEAEKLIGLARSVADFPRMTPEEQDELIRELLDFECYIQAAKLLEWRIASPDQSYNQRLTDYCSLMDIYLGGLENFDGFVAVAVKCVEALALPFSTIRLQIVDAILGQGHFSQHALLYRALIPVMADRAQRVLLLSRLALITEKKLFREGEVEPIYKEILSLDPLNIRALRFYRMWHIQAGEWIAAAGHLHTLLRAYRNPHEQQRAAHELAQIYLYSLNRPERARQILLSHCSDSHLDTRQTLVEALERLGSHDELLDCLDDMLEKAATPVELAAILLKKGQTLIRLERFVEAEQTLSDCLAHDPGNLLIHEALVSAHIGARHPRALASTLRLMVSRTLKPENQKRIGEQLQPLLDLFNGIPPEEFPLATEANL
jgi:thioredoxin-like negative regulator of GroEL